MNSRAIPFSTVRVLLDENLPHDLAAMLAPHFAETVAGVGWAGVTNGELLRRAAGRFDALISMDRGLEFQQPLVRQPFGTVLISSPSNRMVHLKPLVSALLAALDGLGPGEIRRVGA